MLAVSMTCVTCLVSGGDRPSRVGSSYAPLGRSVAPLCINRCITHSGVWRLDSSRGWPLDCTGSDSSGWVAGWRWTAPTDGPSPTGDRSLLGESGGSASGWSCDHPNRVKAVRAMTRTTPGWPSGGLPSPCLAACGDGCRRASAGLPYMQHAS